MSELLVFSRKKLHKVRHYVETGMLLTQTRGGSRAAATFKMERFVIIVNGFQP